MFYSKKPWFIMIYFHHELWLLRGYSMQIRSLPLSVFVYFILVRVGHCLQHGRSEFSTRNLTLTNATSFREIDRVKIQRGHCDAAGNSSSAHGRKQETKDVSQRRVAAKQWLRRVGWVTCFSLDKVGILIYAHASLWWEFRNWYIILLMEPWEWIWF